MVRETLFRPNCCGLMSVVNEICGEILINSPDFFTKQITPEAIRYYATGLLWLRIIELKVHLQMPITFEEKELRSKLDSIEFIVPESIYNYLNNLGKIQTKGGDWLYPDFPVLPTYVIEGQGGYFGPLIESPGVCAEAIRQAVSNAEAGPYQSLLVPAELGTATRNLQGYEILLYRKMEAKNFYLYLGIANDYFPEDIPKTGYYHSLMINISHYIQTLKCVKTLKITKEDTFMNSSGSKAQIVFTIPVDINQSPRSYMDRVVTPVSMENYSENNNSIYKTAKIYGFQLLKEPNLQDHTNWLPVKFYRHVSIPQDWIERRNEMRNLPKKFHENIFICYSIDREPRSKITYFTPNCRNYMLLVNEVYHVLRNRDYKIFETTLSSEMIRYYATGLLWHRIIQIKKSEVGGLTPEELELETMSAKTEFYVPKLIYKYLENLGKFRMKGGQPLCPIFPDLPTYEINGHGGYFGPLLEESAPISAQESKDQNPTKKSYNIVNMYTEYPCLGVCAETIRKAASSIKPGPYQSSLVPPEIGTATRNLQGYENLCFINDEIRDFYRKNNITNDEFQETICKTGYNHHLMQYISSRIQMATILPNVRVIMQKTFRNTFGSMAQVVTIQAMQPACANPEKPVVPLYNDFSARVTSMEDYTENKDFITTAIHYGFQLFKEPIENDHSNWLPINFINRENIPQFWIEHRNQMRDLPKQYYEDIFTYKVIYNLKGQISFLIRNYIEESL
ncbi:uncharacterized protein [Prorops nasuta]|uniref:uncharacterized protein isoform X2 n=1 Tax=Prorops nasuta TaxID=863751 RepID=UPI0034CDE56C